MLKASQAPEWIARWGADLDAIIAAIDNGRGRNPSPERARCFELLDEEVAAGRDPYDRKLARVIANNLMVDSSRVRDWRKDWAKEREYDGN